MKRVYPLLWTLSRDVVGDTAEWKCVAIRVQAVRNGDATRIYSRSGDDVSPSFPELTAALDFPVVPDDELKQIDRYVRTHTAARFGPVRDTDTSLVFEVAGDAVDASRRHASGLAMRFPRIRRILWDKPAHEAERIAALRSLIRS